MHDDSVEVLIEFEKIGDEIRRLALFEASGDPNLIVTESVRTDCDGERNRALDALRSRRREVFQRMSPENQRFALLIDIGKEC